MTDAAAGRRQWSDDTWVYLDDPRMPAVAHGWKLHISARPAALEDLLARVGPVLERHVCHAKHALDADVLRDLNSGRRTPASVGKAVTVYPAPGMVVAVAADLVDALRGTEGPPVLSDLRVAEDAPVYYRYGPFEATYRTGAGGRMESVMTGPDGQLFDGLATGRYRCPPWARDPFRPEPEPGRTTAEPARAAAAEAVLGGRYRVTSGIARAAHGNVYRAVDRDTGLEVVLKQARPYVGEDESGRDARDRLRHEGTVLLALDGVAGVPAFVDYFRHGADEFLVTTDCGGPNLRREVMRNGPFRVGAAGRDPLDLADRLQAILDRVHERGVVVRDVKPDNIVLDASGDCHLVDFGVSAVDGRGPAGATPGYTAPGVPDAGADPERDRYALGVTLGFAATGLDPVLIDDSTAVNRDRTLAGLEAARVDPAVLGRIRTLMKVSDAVRRPPVVDDELLDAIIAHTVAFCVAAARETVCDPSAPIDLYAGSAGLGLELLHHREQPGVAQAVDMLANWTVRQSRELSAGLYSGRTGVALFLQRAGVSYRDEDPWPADRPEGGPPEADLIEGAAGVGLGHLLLADGAASGSISADGPDSRVAEHHLAVAAECHRLVTTGAATLTPVDAAQSGTAALAEGIAHGDAGVTSFLIEYAHLTGEPGALASARLSAERLAVLTSDLLLRALRPEASRRYGSWCRGLAGIGTVLLHAGERLAEPLYVELAQQCADVCVRIAPCMPQVIQCCGLAGVGDFLVSVAAATGDRRRWDQAFEVARLILARSGGPWSSPDFPDVELTGSSAGWAGGSTGVLGFLRRLRDRGGPRPVSAT
ncbi:lanthionine synthetase LanC family protein [Catenulispora subtropica]|uniref:non-specific serine/threonine protein kinase n=1 Tax=Catenulispora subtropica TaxID=450798 RepID=A0ABP5DU62_9ACTN